MKSIILIFITIIGILSVNGQNNNQAFKKENFPDDSFQIEYKLFELDQITIKFVIIKAIKSEKIADDCDIYLNIFKGDSTISEEYLGRTWIGGTFGIPSSQPIDQYFMFIYFGEWHGQITLIDISGNQTSFPGYFWAISNNKKHLLTKANYPDSELSATKFDIVTGKITTKDWHIGLNGDPWKEEKHSNYKGLEINLCE